MKRILALSVLCLAVVNPAPAQDPPTTAGGKPTIVVAPLDGDMTQVLAWQPALGEGLAEMLITELTRLGRFEVLESTALKDLIAEIQLGEAGFSSDKEKVDKGGFAGADFVFRGKVTRFGSNTKGVGLGGFAPGGLGNLGVRVTTSDVRIDWRIIDTYNRKILKASSSTASEKGAGFDVGIGVRGQGGRIGFENREFMNSALGKATAKAVTNICHDLAGVELPESGRRRTKAAADAKQQAEGKAVTDALRATPGKVIAVVNATTLIVSLGSRHGFKSGDKLSLFETIDTKDDKGVVVFTEEKPAGEVTLDAVQEDRSKASYAGSAAIKSGWTVKAK